MSLFVLAFNYLLTSSLNQRSYGIIECAETRYTVFEWAKHGDLQTYLKKHSNLSWAFKLNIVWQIAYALAYCHQMNILHHDVRRYPCNTVFDIFNIGKQYFFLGFYIIAIMSCWTIITTPSLVISKPAGTNHQGHHGRPKTLMKFRGT